MPELSGTIFRADRNTIEKKHGRKQAFRSVMTICRVWKT